jgi:hypothetical protein
MNGFDTLATLGALLKRFHALSTDSKRGARF